MASALRNDKYVEVMNAYKREKVVFIIDECHRSQFGKMHSSIDKHFSSANYIGFTGTPIFRENRSSDGRTTADVFSAGQLDSCIHKYMIKEAIADGNVLKFSVEYMRSINVKKVANPAIDVSKLDDPEYCKRQKVDMETLYHEPERIENIANDILLHLDRHIHPVGKDVYTAIFATDYIPILMQYYRYMKDHNPNGYKIAAIFTYQANEDLDDGADEYSADLLKECIDDYNKLLYVIYTCSGNCTPDDTKDDMLYLMDINYPGYKIDHQNDKIGIINFSVSGLMQFFDLFRYILIISTGSVLFVLHVTFHGRQNIYTLFAL